MENDWFPLVHPIIDRVAREASRKYNDVITFDDAFQVASLWAVQHPAKRDGWIREENWGSIAVSMRNDLRDFCRKELAAKKGYQTRDLFFYDEHEVAGEPYGKITGSLLQCMFDRDSWFSPPAEAIDTTMPRAKKDPAHGAEWITKLADVAQAWKRLPLLERTAIELRYHEDLTVERVAVAMDVTEKVARGLLDRGVHLIMENLGGPRHESVAS